MSVVRGGLRRRVVLVLTAALGGTLGVPAAAEAGAVQPVVRALHDVAGPSRYAGSSCNTATPYYTQPGGKEGEPTVAVDPRHPSRRVVAWMDATRATVDVAYTRDGGRTWGSSVPRGIDECTGNSSQAWEASGDVWASFGPDGTVYLSTLTWAHFVAPPATDYVSVVHVQVSHDGGRTWSKPVFLDGHKSVSDKPMVVADPWHAGVAYEIWRNQSFGMPVGARGATELLFARTTDYGRTWSTPRHIADGQPDDFFGSPQLSVLRDGTLVATTSLANSAGGTDLLAYRSATHGRAWSGAVKIRTVTAGALSPICGQSVAGADTGSSAGQQTVIGGRTVAFVSLDGAAAAAGHGAIVLSTSRDGGLNWSKRILLRRHAPVILASIAASHGGQLGVIWDEIDSAAADCSTAVVPTRSRFAIGTRRGELGRAVTLGSRWWNLASGARGTGGFSGYFIGDYQSLAALPGGFTTVTVQGQPLAGPGRPTINGDTGVVVATIRP
ncbi:MAG: glycoside hydrolase [Actinomycetota bacterium]|nr:glycoside hydrolase [Actinomycetota bacterium]